MLVMPIFLHIVMILIIQCSANRLFIIIIKVIENALYALYSSLSHEEKVEFSLSQMQEKKKSLHISDTFQNNFVLYLYMSQAVSSYPNFHRRKYLHYAKYPASDCSNSNVIKVLDIY